ncbi:hypothetical protein BKA67DRAFT_513505 [Truncatella angustata]|uniref:Carrier domain-containing protein n=1 Tax=Truncatella angustata TaxID=152316 RepID=A0A9P8URG3_9PEZI|nr:uncharacterized protein BKA67DRAFT_513505 [Truncatella angustata]KAH6656998.1 hypothetical protein BKA67DRAFT_513505 [Truncatella angustata]
MPELSEVYGGPLPETCRPFRQMFLDVVAKYPDNLAIACVHQPPGLFNVPNQPLDDVDFRQSPYLRWNYTHLEEAVQRCTVGLRGSGVQPGMPVFTFNTNSVEHVISYWAAADIGCVFVPINPRNLANREEVIHMVNTARKAVPGKRSVDHGWLPFENLMLGAVSSIGAETSGKMADKVIDGYVLFTSGTTSMPKGCFRKFPALNYPIECQLANTTEGMPIAGDRICGVLPNNHAMGHFFIPLTFGVGAAMIFPGPFFQADIMLKTLYREKVTQTVLVPTMMHALIGLKAAAGHRLEHLKTVTFGGAVLTPDHLKSCIEELGTKGVENAYGMTEGLIIRSNSHRDPTKIVDGKDVSSGWVAPGAGLRIIDPDTGKILPRNTLGELHGTATSLGYYIGSIEMDSFYNDPDGRLWFRTGDQARLDHQGRLFITGRYKDIIIRGGENMSPTAIEAAISHDPTLAALNPQVVAASDLIAGEVPIAVMIGKVDADLRDAVQNAVLKSMGNIYVPEDVVSLQDLGLTDYPRTMAGKVQKTKLASLVKDYRAKREILPASMNGSDLGAEVREIWAKTVGLEPNHLALDAQISEFADSITVMRVRDIIRKKIGKTLSLVEMASAGTVSGHIELLKKQSGAAGVKNIKRTIRSGPPSIEDTPHLMGESESFEPMKKLVIDTISPYGLNWNDVEDVIPVYDFGNMMVRTGLFDSWGFKFAMVSKKVDKKEFREALERVLQNNRTLASFLVGGRKSLGAGEALHVAVRQNNKLFDIVINDMGKLKTLDDLRVKALDYREQVAYPGPLTRIDLYDIEETGTPGVVLCIDHAVVDASTGLIFSADLEKALSSTAQLPEHTDYKLWADSYFNQRTSAEAKVAVQWHVKQLRELHSHRKALWPPYTMPKKADEYIVASSEPDAVHHSFDTPAIHEFRQNHPKVTATIVAKTALSLLIVSHTHHTHAVFANLEAARTNFPFLPKAIEATGQFEATDVSGPTIQAVINLVEYNPSESVLSLLQRLQEDQLNLTKYAPAPLHEVMSALGEAGDMIPEVLGHLSFNWVPGLGASGTNQYQNFEALAAIVRPCQGMSWNVGLGGPHGNTFFVDLRGISFNPQQQKQLALKFEEITKWLLRKENWQSSVGAYVTVI